MPWDTRWGQRTPAQLVSPPALDLDSARRPRRRKPRPGLVGFSWSALTRRDLSFSSFSPLRSGPSMKPVLQLSPAGALSHPAERGRRGARGSRASGGRKETARGSGRAEGREVTRHQPFEDALRGDRAQAHRRCSEEVLGERQEGAAGRGGGGRRRRFRKLQGGDDRGGGERPGAAGARVLPAAGGGERLGRGEQVDRRAAAGIGGDSSPIASRKACSRSRRMV
jgi:hypothetical protein